MEARVARKREKTGIFPVFPRFPDFVYGEMTI